ncbi:MAG: hypothetical protein ACM3S2_21785 [Ignavibacteriales bacterium]
MPVKLKRSILLCIILLSFLQFNCGKTPVYRVVPVGQLSEWDFGREVVSSQDSLGKVTLSFEAVRDNYYVFYLNYQNFGHNSVLLDPAEIYYTSYRDSIDGNLSASGRGARISAVDPELTLLGIERRKNDLEASEGTRLGVNAVVGTIDLVAAIATIGKKRSSEEVKKEENEREQRRISEANARIEYENNMAKMSNEKDYWQNEVLRKVTVHPDEKEGGYFHLPINKKAGLLRLVVPVDSSLYYFDYRQLKL